LERKKRKRKNKSKLKVKANSLRWGIQWGSCNPPDEQICGIDNDCTEHIPQIGLLL